MFAHVSNNVKMLLRHPMNFLLRMLHNIFQRSVLLIIDMIIRIESDIILIKRRSKEFKAKVNFIMTLNRLLV